MSRVSGQPYFAYVLWSDAGGRFYIGISEDPQRRLEQHNSTGGKGWTARYRPWRLAWTQRVSSYREARQLENKLKSQARGAGFFKLTGLDPEQYPRHSGS